jgi:hypothetical protein
MVKTIKTVTYNYPADGGDPRVPHLERDAYKARLVHAVEQGNVRYAIRPLGGDVYHLKAGHLSTNIAFGACGQCYKYDVDLSNPQEVRVHSTVPCAGWWGGVIGANMEVGQEERVMDLLQLEFSERRVVWCSW